MNEFMTNQQWAVLIFMVVICACALVVAHVTHQNVKRFRAIEPKPIPRTPISYALRLGPQAFIIGAHAPVGQIVIGGWLPSSFRWEIGDYLLVYVEGLDTRYRIDSIERHPSSGWFSVECTFAPRGAVAAVKARVA